MFFLHEVNRVGSPTVQRQEEEILCHWKNVQQGFEKTKRETNQGLKLSQWFNFFDGPVPIKRMTWRFCCTQWEEITQSSGKCRATRKVSKISFRPLPESKIELLGCQCWEGSLRSRTGQPVIQSFLIRALVETNQMRPKTKNNVKELCTNFRNSFLLIFRSLKGGKGFRFVVGGHLFIIFLYSFFLGP